MKITTILMMVLVLLSGTGLNTMSSASEFTTKQEIRLLMAHEIECLAKNIYYEAASEPYEGKLAVAQVTMNRTRDPNYPKNVCDVVYQKTQYNGKTTCQFSWTCEKVYEVRSKYEWEESVYVARKALTQYVLHDKIFYKNALHYHATYVDPKWSANKVVTKIGNHIFYL